jgi:aminoglycoside phosphotransferase (APT) family kinase protein
MAFQELIKSTFEAQMQKKADSIHRLEDVPNNSVYRIEAESQSTIFKVYSSGWPEEGKLPFVSRKLTEANIPYAKIFAYSRKDEHFPHGYIIEECLPGITANRLAQSYDGNMVLKKLAQVVSRIHQIKLSGYGYTGSGIAEWSTFSEYMYDTLDDNIPSIAETGVMSAAELTSLNQSLYEKLKACDVYPSVLTHGDLSAKNIMVHNDEITLIDWDDIHSLCWMADIARMTLWMKLGLGKDAAAAMLKVFLDHYETEHDKAAFYEMEDALHVWYGLDCLNHFKGSPMGEKIKEQIRESARKCGICP